MSVEVFAADEQTDVDVDTLRWVRLARDVLAAEGVGGDVEMSMLFIDEPAMTELNRRFMGGDGPTDVLAFPIDEDLIEAGRSPDAGGPGPGSLPHEASEVPIVLGDVVVCPSVARRQAPDHAGTYDDEMALLVVHGILHLLGMDHAKAEEAEVMERRQRELLDKFHHTR